MKAQQGSLSSASAQGIAVPKIFAGVVSVPFCLSNPRHPRHTLFPNAARSSQVAVRSSS
jgi:hypothetical protein